MLRAVLTTEESVGSLVAHAKPGSDINIRISAFMGTVSIGLSSEGEEYDPSETVDMADPLEAKSLGEARGMLQRIFLAVLCGVAAGLIGKYLELVKDLFEAFNDLFF